MSRKNKKYRKKVDTTNKRARLEKKEKYMKKQGFTIIELLTVIAIMAILMGFGMLAFTRISQGANIRNALLQIKSVTHLAQSHSIVTRQRVAFFIPTQILVSNAYVRPNMLDCSIFILKESSSGIADPTSLSFKAELLPDGVVFNNNYTNWKDMEFITTNGVTLFKGKCFRYAPHGTIYHKDQELMVTIPIVVKEGKVDEAGVKTYKQNAISCTATVYAVSGRCKLPN